MWLNPFSPLYERTKELAMTDQCSGMTVVLPYYCYYYQRLSSAEWFSSKISAACLFETIYSKANNEAEM